MSTAQRRFQVANELFHAGRFEEGLAKCLGPREKGGGFVNAGALHLDLPHLRVWPELRGEAAPAAAS